MYKCSECGLEYKIKPDYCDCGNDTFIEIIKEEKEIKKQTNAVENSILKENMPSIIFLIFCIILSFAILFFVGNPKEQSTKEIKKQEKINNIPNIDDIWNDEKPKQVIIKQEIKPEEPKITKVELKKEPIKINKPIQILEKIQPKATQKKAAIKAQPKNQVSKQQIINKPAQQPLKIEVKPQPIVQKPIVQNNQTQKQEVKTVQQNVIITPSVQINPQELKEYKKALRNKIASNIDFLNIAGDGKCVLSFNVSQGGNLLNRKFVSQSSNISLNDAVYQGMLKVSSFKTPPLGYKNETMRLTVQIIGGNFSVSLE